MSQSESAVPHGGDTPGQWARILWLDQEIRAERYPGVRQLQEEFSISRRTAFNTVTFLRYSLGAPLEHDKRRQGYFYTDPTFGLPTMFLQEGELLAMLLAQQVTRQYLGTPLEAPLRSAIQKINRYLPEKVRVQLGDVADAFHFAGAAATEVSLSVMAEIQEAIRRRRLLRMLYYTVSRDETRERVIEPHFLSNIRGDWMLVAWDRWRERDRVFKLSRIRDCQVLDERFTPRPQLNPQDYSEHRFFVEHGSEPYETVIRFDSFQARWVRERRWHASQELEELPDGSILLRLRVAGEWDLQRWILSYGSHAEVLEPAWLRERLAAEARKLAEQYSR